MMQQSTPLPTIGMPRVRPILAGCATIVVFVFIFVNLGTSEYPSFRPVKADSCSVPTTPPPPPTLKDQNAGHSYSVTTQKYPVHPIPILMAAGELKWQSMLRGQSRTLRAAVKEYKARYGMNPPDGFDLWFQYAKEQNVVLIDEFDEMMTAMEPLRKLGKEELRRRSDALLKFGIDYSLGGVIIGGQTTFTHVPEPAKDTPSDPSIMEHPGGYRTAGFLEMLAPVKEILRTKAASWPVFSVPVNELAEARVVAGDEYWPEAAVMNISSSYTHNDLFHEHQHGARTLSEDLARACGPESNLAKKAAGTRFEFGIEEVLEPKHGLLGGEGRKPEFVIDPNSDNDMCERPELMTVHGVFRGTSSTTKGLFPILSYGRPSAFSDIPIPSRYQWDADGSYQYNPDDEVAWENKNDVLYWRGEPSGGGHGDASYGSMHRHRLVAITNPKHFKSNVTLTGAAESNRLIETTEPGYMAQAHTNVSFSDISSMCEMFGCDLPSKFPFELRNPFGEAWRNKLVIDSDGWGPSGRWRALMESKSVAVRSSVYREWFSPRMIPWVHYVPVSVGLSEVWGVLGYFLGTADGGMPHDLDAKKIAEEGSKWVAEHMRKTDMTVYCFRLILELNRLFNGEEWVYKEAL
ncbi:hypothetical protein BZA77DRAFT_53046 [Pyronema omphalodes]|nr:hypothetical protein BZA77DRAFT_53046 [Pyronema omphalodes]